MNALIAPQGLPFQNSEVCFQRSRKLQSLEVCINVCTLFMRISEKTLLYTIFTGNLLRRLAFLKDTYRTKGIELRRNWSMIKTLIHCGRRTVSLFFPTLVAEKPCIRAKSTCAEGTFFSLSRCFLSFSFATCGDMIVFFCLFLCRRSSRPVIGR